MDTVDTMVDTVDTSTENRLLQYKYRMWLPQKQDKNALDPVSAAGDPLHGAAHTEGEADGPALLVHVWVVVVVIIVISVRGSLLIIKKVRIVIVIVIAFRIFLRSGNFRSGVSFILGHGCKEQEADGEGALHLEINRYYLPS